MKIAYNPKTAAALTTAPANNDITFDLRGLNIFVRGEKFKGTDTTYSVFKKHTSAGSGGYNGLVPVPSYTATNIRFLREDGTWSIPAAAAFIYTQLTNQDLDDYLDEGKWYYAGGGNSVVNKPSGVDAFELYVGRNAIGYRYQKLITSSGIIWFRYYNSTAWKTWVRWYTDQNTDQKVLQSATTTANFRPVILGYTSANTPSGLSANVTQQVYTTTTIYAQPSTGSLWANKLYSGGKPVLTEHQSLANYVTLNTAQTITGTKTFSTQQKFTVATGTSPFTVSSTTVVSNLNADMLDGWHLNYILKDGYVTSATSGLSSYWRKVWDITLNNQYNDVDINLLVHSAYNQQWGIISFRLRQNGTGTAKNISAYLAEVVGNIPLDRFRLYYNNSSGLCQLWCNPSGQYDVYNYRVLAKTWRIGTEAATLGTFYTGNTTTAQSLPSDSYVSMAGITIVNTAAKVANTLTFSAGKFSSKTYNGSSAITVNVPTHTSHLTNDSGFWTGTRYWANIAVSTSSSTSTSPTFSTAYTSNWFRSTGSTGWYSQTYGGGWYMADSTWIRTYGSKSVYQNTGQIRTDGYLVTNGGLTAGATSPNNGTYKLHVTGASWSSGLIRAGGGFYHNSVNSNSYVLLAGGSYKGLGDFAKGNAGSATKGVYVTGGTVTAMTYSLSSNLNSGTSGKLAYYSSATTVAAYSSSVGASNRGVYMNAGVPTVMAYYLNATVNSGTSGKLAYYSGSNTLSSYTSTVGSAAQPIYLNAGSPSASSYSFTGTYSNPVIVWCGEIYRSAPGSTYWYSTKKGGCCSISFTTNNAGSNGNLIISIPHCEPYAAFCSTVRIFDGSTAISAGDGTISGRSAGMGDYMTICGISGTTGNVYIRKFSQQNKENDSWRNGELGTTTTSDGNKPVARFYLMIVGRYI